jgi:hypothetical protein
MNKENQSMPYLSIYVCIYVCVCTYIYIYIYIYMKPTKHFEKSEMREGEWEYKGG